MNQYADHKTHGWKYWYDEGRKANQAKAKRRSTQPKTRHARCRVCGARTPWFLLCDLGVCNKHKHNHPVCRKHYVVGLLGIAYCRCGGLFIREGNKLRCSRSIPKLTRRAAAVDWFSKTVVERACDVVKIDSNLRRFIQVDHYRRKSREEIRQVVEATDVHIHPRHATDVILCQRTS